MHKITAITAILGVAAACVGYRPADLTRDGVVDFRDLSVLATDWLAESQEPNIVPLYEFGGDSGRVSVSREGTGYNLQLQEFAAHTPRRETVCVAAIGEVESFPQAGFVARGVTADHVYVSHGSALKLSTTRDGIDYTEVLDLTSAGIIDEGITGAKELADGSLLVFTSSPGGYRGHTLRRADANAAWAVVNQTRGCVEYWGLTGFNDNGECVVGTYGRHTPSPGWDNPRSIWYSGDYGQTWAEIYRHADLGDLHCHLATFSPLDTSTIYAAYGDLVPNSRVMKLEYTGGGKYDPSHWREADNSPLLQRIYNPVFALPHGDYIYWGRDSGHYPIILKHDVRRDTFAEVHDSPRYNYGVSAPYYTGGLGLACFSMTQHNGLLYAAVRDTGGTLLNPNNGIYVSADGDHWSCVYRKEMSGCDHWCGFFTIVGYSNGYLWGAYSTQNNSSGTWRMYRMKPVAAATKSALYVERGATNVLSEDASCFENGVGGWVATQDVNSAATGRTTQEALVGSACLRVVPQDNGVGYLTLKGPCWNPKPSVGDYIVASAYIKAGPEYPEDYGGEGPQTSRFRIAVEGAGNGAIYSQASRFYISKHLTGWRRVVTWGKCTNDQFNPTLGPRLVFDLGRGDYKGDRFADAVHYIDAVSVVYFNDLHYSGSWIRGGSARPDEIGVIPLAGVGTRYSVSMTWLPVCSSREWHGNMSIAAVAGADGSHVNLLYDKLSSRFTLDDGTHRLLTAGTYTWEHHDLINLCIVHDGTGTTLHIKTSLEAAGESVADSDIRLGALPVFMLLSTDYYGVSPGCGKFANIRVWDSALSTADVHRAFDTVTDILAP